MEEVWHGHGMYVMQAWPALRCGVGFFSMLCLICMLRHAPHVALLTPLLHAAASLPCSHVACASRHARQPLCQWTCSRTQLALMSYPKPDLNWLPITRNHGCRWTLCYWTPPTAPRAGPSRPSRRRSAAWLRSWQPRRQRSQVSWVARGMLSTFWGMSASCGRVHGRRKMCRARWFNEPRLLVQGRGH